MNKHSIYQIQVRGLLDSTWSHWFDGFKLESIPGPDGSTNTLLTGPVPDQPALFGVLLKIRDLNLELIEVKKMNAQPITKEQFVKRLTGLLLRSGLADFPKDDTDRHILLKSAVLTLGPVDTLTEKEVSEKLDIWVKDIAQVKSFDRVTLRRYLIDAGYLTRSKDGSSYAVARPAPRAGLFDPAVEEVAVTEVVAAAREEIARRKREYMEKNRGA